MSGTTAFFNRTYDEALEMLMEARDYIAHHEAREAADLHPELRLTVSCEAMRVTSRLTQVMAWLLAQKAVQSGEMTIEQAAGEEFRLSGGAVCTTTGDPERIECLPHRLRSLLDRSHSLYMRVLRLEAQVRANVA